MRGPAWRAAMDWAIIVAVVVAVYEFVPFAQ